MKQRKHYNAMFKFGVAVEAVKGVKTINQVASEYGVHPHQVSQWKQQLMKEGATVFNGRMTHHEREQKAQEAELFEQIGRLKMELEWVKKKATRIS